MLDKFAIVKMKKIKKKWDTDRWEEKRVEDKRREEERERERERERDLLHLKQITIFEMDLDICYFQSFFVLFFSLSSVF